MELKLQVGGRAYPIIGNLDTVLITRKFKISTNSNNRFNLVNYQDRKFRSLTPKQVTLETLTKKILRQGTNIGEFKVKLSKGDSESIINHVIEYGKITEIGCRTFFESIKVLSDDCIVTFYKCQLIKCESNSEGIVTLLILPNHTTVSELNIVISPVELKLTDTETIVSSSTEELTKLATNSVDSKFYGNLDISSK